jgi:biopolymer transport protein ExbD
MSIKKKRRISIRIDMTPMVDIAFLLLIFYMTTTQFKPPEAKAVTLPESHSQIELPDKDIVNVTVTKKDSIYVDFLQKEKVVIDGAEMTTTVRKYAEVDTSNAASVINRARAINLKALIVIKADKDASFGVMNAIMNSMSENNITRFLIITDNEGKTEMREAMKKSGA